MHTVTVVPANWHPDEDPEPINKSQTVLRELLRASSKVGIRVETLTTVAQQPMEEIARVAQLHRCESVLLGLSKISDANHGTQLELLLGRLDANVVVLRSRKDWKFADVKKILVPIAGRGGHQYLRAQLLGSLLRNTDREVTFLRVLPAQATSDEVRRAKRDLRRIADDEVRQSRNIELMQSDDPLQTVAELAEKYDLLILGVQRLGRRKKLFGGFTRRIAQLTSCPIIVMSRRG